jgi:hypothetical protein
MDQLNKPKIYSTTMWSNLLIIVLSTFLLYMGKIPAEWWAIAVGVSGAGYNIKEAVGKNAIAKVKINGEAP